MSSTTSSKTMMATMMAMLVVLGSAVVMLGTNDSDAAITGDYGEIYNIDLAPGFKYTYTPTFPADLEVSVSIQQYEEAGINASMSGNTLTVTVKDGVTSGSYDLILMSTTDTGGIHQELPQHIRINIVPGLSVSGSINNIVLGASVDFTPSSSSGMTDHIDWSVNGNLPAGLQWNGGKITGTPTEVGTHTISLTANAAGETKDLDISFTVYNVIVNGQDQQIYSHGNTVSTSPISQAGDDLGVTWSVTSGELPEGFTLDASTGVVSGSSTTLGETTVTVTGTSTTMSGIEQQSASFDVTIRSEPQLEVTGDSTITTYPESVDKTTQMTATAGTSAVTWSVSSATGVSISATGLVTVTDEAAAGSVTVTATTAYGQIATKTVTIITESVIDITGPASASAIAGAAKEFTYLVQVEGATWSVDTSTVPAGATVTIDPATGVMSVSGTSPTEEFTVTVTATTDSGQTDSMTVTCKIVSQLIFTNDPSNGMSAWIVG